MSINFKDARERVLKAQGWLYAAALADAQGLPVPSCGVDKVVDQIEPVVRGATATLNLSGVVGLDIDAGEVQNVISGVDVNTIVVNIDSPGGNYRRGRAIANALRNHPAKVVTVNQSLAASVASVIFAAGDERIASEGSVMMIHDSQSGSLLFGNKEQIEKQYAEFSGEAFPFMEKANEEIANTYKRISNLGVKDIREMMTNETYFDADEQVKHGFATANEMPSGVADGVENVGRDAVCRAALELLAARHASA